MAEETSFARTDEQTMLAETVRDFVNATVDLDAVRAMSLTDFAFHRDAWDGLREMGLLGLHVPEEYGGAGYTFVETGIVFEELGRSVVPVPMLSQLLAVTAITEAGSEEQKLRILPDLVSGNTVATLAAFEDPHNPDTVDCAATRTDDGWSLSGIKPFVTDAPNAGLFVVSAMTGDGVRLFVVESGADGLSVEATPSLDATRPLGLVVLDGVAVSADARLAGDDHVRAIGAAFDLGVVALAQEQAGGAEQCLTMSVEYAKSRFQFGRAIGSFQAVKHMCADMLVSVEHAKSAAWHAAKTVSDPDESPVSTSVARSVCSRAYVDVAADGLQIHGGIGFTWEHDIHLHFKRAKADSLILGSSGQYLDRLADAIGI